MRIFRTEEAAQKAGFVLGNHMRGLGSCAILTERERLMLEALEANAAAFREAKQMAVFWSDALLCQQAAERTEALIKELNVEG